MVRVVAFLALVLLVTVAAPSSRSLAAPAQALDWQACGRFQCATLSVPLDYANPGGRQISLALVRQQARDPANRIGSLLADPGGPGASGVDFVKGWAPALPREVQNRFDIVGFDPRGVGQSTPLVCHDEIQKLAAADPNPETEDQWRQVEAETKAFVDVCNQRGEGVLPYLGTQDVVRDMDAIRQALGDDKLTYFGYSYGTTIGQVYADTFPDRVRAIVLDGAVNTALSADDFSLQQALGFEGALSHFLADCARKQCITANRADPKAAVEELIRRTEAAPIPAPGADRPAGPGETVLAIIGSLYSDREWSRLARAVENGLDGDGTDLVRLADNYLGRSPDGSYDNSTEMNMAVNCVDYVFSRDPAHYEQISAQFEKVAPHFGAAVGEGGLGCAYWAAPPSPLRPPTARGAPPILVIGTTGDPATPYAWAVAVSKQIESAVLLTYYGEGHTVYLRGNQCVDSAVDAYIIDLTLPARGTTCGDPALSTPIDVGAQNGSGPPAAAATAAPNPTAASQPAARSNGSGGNGWVVPVVIAVVGVILAGLAFAWARSRGP